MLWQSIEISSTPGTDAGSRPHRGALKCATLPHVTAITVIIAACDLCRWPLPVSQPGACFARVSICILESKAACGRQTQLRSWAPMTWRCRGRCPASTARSAVHKVTQIRLLRALGPVSSHRHSSTMQQARRGDGCDQEHYSRQHSAGLQAGNRSRSPGAPPPGTLPTGWPPSPARRRTRPGSAARGGPPRCGIAATSRSRAGTPARSRRTRLGKLGRADAASWQPGHNADRPVPAANSAEALTNVRPTLAPASEWPDRLAGLGRPAHLSA